MAGFFDIVTRARQILDDHDRVSLGALRREFELDDDGLEELAHELVDVQGVAVRDQGTLRRASAADASLPTPVEPTPGKTPASSVAIAHTADGGERRQLTVMFCDLVGSTALGNQLDPEEFRDLLHTYQDVCSQSVNEFEGHVAQFLGDGVLVYFGYPIAHEDDAERAIRAGLMLQQRVGELNTARQSERQTPILVRIGIHTGPVVVSQMGGDAHRETLALGDTTNVASRIEHAAEPGSIVASDATLRLVSGLFVTRDLGSPELRGISESIRIHEITPGSAGVRSRFDPTTALTPLTGRDQECGLFMDRWEQVEEGRGHVLFISGEAGIGKSRLLQAFRHGLGSKPHTFIDTTCSPYAAASAFQPTIELLERGLGFEAAESAEEKLVRLEAGIEGLSTEIAARTVPYLIPLLGLPGSDRYTLPQISPELQRERTIAAQLEIVMALQEIQPVLLVMEDLHWADPSTLEFIGQLIDQAPTARLLVALTARPEFEPPWPLSRAHVSPITLTRLTRRHTREMLNVISSDIALPEEVLEQIVARADGIPLFVEELTKSVLGSELVKESGGRYDVQGSASDLAIPETLQDSLMARLDRLSAAKQVAQLAATLGREFHYDLIAAVSELDQETLRAGLQQIVDAEVLYQRGAPPTALYTFKHALLQDTAYQSQLRSTRRALHARIVKVIEEDFPKRASAEPERMAYHCRQAEFTYKAIGYSQSAGDMAVTRFANPEAIEHFNTALELLRMLPEDAARHLREVDLRVAIGGPLVTVNSCVHPEVVSNYDRIDALSKQVGDGPEQLPALIGLINYRHLEGAMPPMAATAERIMQAAKKYDIKLLEAGARVSAGAAAITMRPTAEALEQLETAVALLRETAPPPPQAVFDMDLECLGLALLSIAQCVKGQLDQSVATAEASVTRAREVGHAFTLAQALGSCAIGACMMDDRERTRSYCEEAIPIAERCGFRTLDPELRGLWGWTQGSDEAGLRAARESIELAASSGVAFAYILHICLASTLLDSVDMNKTNETNETSEIDSHLTEARRLMVRNGERAYESQLLLREARLGRLRGEPIDHYESMLEQSITTAQEYGMLLMELHATYALTRIRADEDRVGDSAGRLAALCDRFTEGFGCPPLQRARELLQTLA